MRLSATLRAMSVGFEYTDVFLEEATGQWISRAEVAQVGFTALAGH